MRASQSKSLFPFFGICHLIKLNNKSIPVSSETKYLGVLLDKQLTYGPPPKKTFIFDFTYPTSLLKGQIANQIKNAHVQNHN